jgi:hypothetical protein
MVKDLENRKKARCACNVSTIGGKVRVLSYTYANFIDHMALLLFFGVAAAKV